MTDNQFQRYKYLLLVKEQAEEEIDNYAADGSISYLSTSRHLDKQLLQDLMNANQEIFNFHHERLMQDKILRGERETE